MMRAPMIATALAALALVPAALAAQGPRRANTGVEFRTFSFDATGQGETKTVRQLAVPLGLVIPLSSRLQVDLGTYFAQAERTALDTSTTNADSNTTSLSGLTDLQARVVAEIVPDAVVFTLSANLPTGQSSLTQNELLLAGNIASDLISFPVASFGSGLAVTSGLAFAMPVGSWAVGFAGSYRYSGEFDINNTKYRPGGEARLRFGVDRLVGQGRVSLGFTYSSFSTDELGGTGAFRSGARIIPQVSVSMPMGNNNLALYVWDVIRAAGEYTATGTQAPKQNTLALGAMFGFQMGRSSFRPSIEFRRQTEAGLTSGTLLSVGARYQTPLSGRITVTPSARFDTGSSTGGDSFTGFGFGLALSTEW